jgi:hypothetical protein
MIARLKLPVLAVAVALLTGCAAQAPVVPETSAEPPVTENQLLDCLASPDCVVLWNSVLEEWPWANAS